MEPTNRISSDYSAHVFSRQPMSRIDTIGDNGKHSRIVVRLSQEDTDISEVEQYPIQRNARFETKLLALACAGSQTGDGDAGGSHADLMTVLSDDASFQEADHEYLLGREVSRNLLQRSI